MTQADKLIRFVSTCEQELFPQEPNATKESTLRARLRRSLTTLERMERYDQAGLVTPAERKKFDALFRDVIDRERVARNEMQEENQRLELKGLR